MLRTAANLLLILIVFIPAACVEIPHEPGSQPAKTPENVDSPSGPAPPARAQSRSVVREEKAYRIERVDFNPISARLWRPTGGGPHPAILLLPGIWGDRNMEDFANRLVKEGFVCLQLSSERYLQRIRSQKKMTLDDLADLIHDQVVESDRMLGWLKEQEDVDPDRIGVLGVSIGAILATLLTEQDENIRAAAFVLGGGNLPEIMAAPQGYVKRRLRNRIMTENGLNEEQFKKAAVDSFERVDPLSFPGRLEAGRILMVNGRFDNVIPYKNAKELWMELGRPDWLVLPAGHYTASFFLSYITHRVADHFVQQFG